MAYGGSPQGTQRVGIGDGAVVTSVSLTRLARQRVCRILHFGPGRNRVPTLALAYMCFRDEGSGTNRRAMGKAMARKSSKKIRKPASRAKRAAKAKPLVAAAGSVRRERSLTPAQVAKRAAKAKPLVAASASVRRGRARARLDATVPAVTPLAPAFSLMDTVVYMKGRSQD